MPESTLSLSYPDLEAEVGYYAGWGRGAAYGSNAFTTDQQQSIDTVIKQGLRMVYYPDPVDGQESAYSWSFLHPVAKLQVPNSTRTLPMPDDYGGIEGRISVTLPGSVGNMYWPVEFVGVGQVYQAEANFPSTTGRVEMACVEPLKQTTPVAGQRFQLHVWPLPDQAYNLIFQYYVNPDAITASLPFPLGGMMMAETIRAACLAAAEVTLNDIMGGPNWQRFQARLIAAISADRRMKPQTLGYNGDRSDGYSSLYGREWPWNHYQDQITVNGVLY